MLPCAAVTPPVLTSLSQRLLPVLQLTRMALVFTAIADSTCGLLLPFSDIAGKSLVAPGLTSLGLIRFFHAIIPAPEMPLLWHPLLLLNHVTILSTVAYVWEQKRPALTPLHWWTVLGMLGFIDAASIGMIAWRRPSSFWIQPTLLLPAAAVLLFVGVALTIRLRTGLRRE